MRRSWTSSRRWDASPGISLLTRDLAGRLTGSAESAASVQDEYYHFVLERLMDGLEDLTTSQR